MTALARREKAILAAIALTTALAGVLRYTSSVSRIAAFAVATVALGGQAWVVSFATEQLGRRAGPGLTGFLQATLGNLPEFFVVVFALQAGERVVAETALIGSVFANALLVLGVVLIVGARRSSDGLMHFGQRLPNDTTTLTLIATFIIVLVGLAGSSHDGASHHIGAISVIGAIAILVVYAIWSAGYLRSDDATRRPEPDREGARLSLGATLALLLAGAGASALTSDWFINALRPTLNTIHVSRAFAGIVIVAIAGNAVEHVVGIVLARRGQPDLAISVVKNSIGQIAAFLYPLLVVVSLATHVQLTFALSPVYAGALFGTAIIVWQITGDGEATVFEGAALIAAYVILATVAAFE